MKGDMILPWEDQEADVNDSTQKDALDLLAGYMKHKRHLEQLEAFYKHAQDHKRCCSDCPDVEDL